MAEKASTTKKVVTTGVVGLNAAALLFLYTNFVPRTEYNRLLQQYDKTTDEVKALQTKVAVQEATLDVYRGTVGKPFE